MKQRTFNFSFKISINHREALFIVVKRNTLKYLKEKFFYLYLKKYLIFEKNY